MKHLNLWWAIIGAGFAIWMGFIGHWVPFWINAVSAAFNGWVWWETREFFDAARR